MASNISGDGISPDSVAFVALPITMTFMMELLSLVDGNEIEAGHFPTFVCSRTGISPIDNGLQNRARNLLATPIAQETARKIQFSDGRRVKNRS
jgi:hypothetical protein